MPRARNAIASTATRTPRIVTTRTPLFMRRDGAKMELIWGKCEAEYFCRAIWTTQITLNWLVKFVFLAQPVLRLQLLGPPEQPPGQCARGDHQQQRVPGAAVTV